MAAKYGVSSQNISRTDVLCEGPVRGLKNGEASIFFNDVASEDANLRGYNPIEGTSSGKLTFDGSSATNTGITGATIPIDLDLGDRRPRPLELKNYKSTNVTLSSVTASNGTGSVTCTASSGTPFTDDAWDTQGTALRTAYLKRDGVLLKGEFFKTSASAGTFVFNGVTDVIDTTETHELRISYRFFIQSITNSSTLTLKAVPAAGTYFFEIPPLQLAAGNAAARNNYRASKITGIQAEFRPGHRYQDPLNEIGGVGGAVAATQSVNHELKVIGTGELTGINPVPEDGTIGSTMESGLPDDSQDDVATDAVVLNDTAFGITAAQRPEVDEISLRITYPGGLQSMNNNKGRRDPAYARYLIQIQTTLDNVDSAWENAFPREGAYIEHTGRTNAAYSFDHILGVNQYRPFDSFKVRVIRLTRHIGLRVNSTGHGDGVTDKEKWTLIAKSKIDQLGYVIKDRLSYPYTSVISTSFSSKQYQEPPKMSYLMQGLKVKVPSTYTPREYSTQTDSNGNPVAVYEEFWDGTFKNELQYTDNPAWVFYDIVTNNRYGAGKWIQESDIDKYALYRIARYCDELVDNGAGGTEPRFRSNIFLTKATDVYKVLKDFASTFTGMLYWMDGQLTPVQDSPSDPVYNFTKGNVIDGKFGYESSGTKTRSNQVIVTWNDPEANYEPVPLIVEDREAIVRDKRIITEEVVAFGCTSEAQAIRYGRWKLWTAQKQTEIVSFKSALNSLYIKPGDIINVQDADREGVQYSGRLASGTSTAAVLDRSVTLNAGSTYTLSTLVTEPAVFYVGSSDIRLDNNGNQVETGGTVYSRGDRITTSLYNHNGSAYASVTLDTEAKASNAFYKDLSNEYHLLPIVWKEYSYVQENAVTTSAGTTNTIDVSGFETTPVANTIWALKESKDGLDVVGSYKKYRVLSINQDKSNEYGFSAVEHYDEKYGAVDSGYETGVIPTTVYVEAEPRDGETEMAAPSSPRVILESDPDKPGEEIKVEWEPSTSDFVEAYEIRHNIPDIENPLRTSDTFLRLTGITSDRLSFEIRAVSTGGNFSPYARVSYTFLDVYEEAIPRVAQGIPRGAFSSAQLILTALNTIQFQATNAQVSPPSDPETIYTLTGSTNIANISADEDYLVYLNTSVPELQILYYDTDSLASAFYYDVGTGNSPLSSSWTSIGSVSIPANSNTVTGSGFLNSVVIGDVLNLAGTTSPTDRADGAVVVDVVSNTELVIDKVFDTAKSSLTAYRANFRPDYSSDSIIAKLRKTGSNIKLKSFLTLRTIVDDITLSTGDDGTTEVPDGAITVDKLAANSITADKIQANAISAREIDADSINANHIVAGEITADAIAANAITADKVTANSVVATLLTASAVTATDISATNLSSISANIGDITAGTLKGGNIIDANSAPGTGESGAFLNLTGGKMVFGNASKYVLFDGTNLELNGVVIDASSTVNATATPELIVKEDGTAEITDAASLNFTSGLNLAVSGTEATISLDTPTDNNFTSALLSKLNGIADNANNYSLPTATPTVLGGIKVGNRVSIASGVLSADIQSDVNFTSALNTKLAGIESGATADQTAAEIRVLVGSATDSNVFTDTLLSKLNGIADNANNYSLPTASPTVLGGIKVGNRVSIASGVLSADIQSDNNFTTTLKNKLDGIESGATGDQTAAEIRSLVESATDSNVFTDADHTKLNNIEAGATGDQTASEIRALVASATDSNVFTDADHTKLDGIETGATADQTAAEIRTLVESASDSNVFTDADHTKLNGIATGANAYVLPTNNVTNASVSGSTLTLSREGASDVTFTDTNTQYSAGSGLGLSGTTFSVDSTVVRTTGTQTIGGTKTFTGDVTFSGTTTYINTTTLNVGDNIITLNADFTGSSPTESAGIEVERGTQANALFQYKESGVGITGDLAAGWSVGTSRIEATGFYGTFYGDASNLSNINADSLSGLSTADLAEDPSATTSSGTMYFTNARARSALSGGTGISYNNTTGAIVNSAPDQTVSLTGGGATSISGTYPNFTISSTDTNTVPNNATITISAGTDLATGGNFTTDQSFAETITINHADITRTNNTSSASPGYGGTFTAIDSITTNARGHVTAVNTKTVTIPASDNTDTNTVTQIREDSGSYRTGNITLQSGSNVTISEPSAGVFNFAATDTNTTNFNIQASGGTATNISAGETINFTGGGATSVSRSGNTITFTSTDTNTDTNNYVSSVSFATSTGVLTLNRAGLSALTVDLDGRYSTTDTNYYLDGITKSGNTLTFSVNGATNQSYTFGSNAFTSTTIPTNNNQLTNGAGYVTANYYLDGITKSGNTLTFSVNGTTNQSYTFGSNAFTSTTIPTNNNQLTNGAGYTTNTGTVTSVAVSAGTGLSGGGTVTTSGTISLAVDLSELADMTAAVDTSVDELILLDNGEERRKRFAEIFGSNAYNSTTIPTNNNQLTNGAGYTTNTGTVTSVSGGTGLSGTVTTSGSLNLTNTGVTAATYGSSTNIPQIAVDAQGRITSASNVAVSIPSGANNATITLSAGDGLTGGESFTTDQSSNETITFAVDSTVLRAGTGTLINDIINANVITADMIQANSIVATIITAEEITASHIATNTITANEIAAGAITASELQISNNSGGSAGIFMDYNSGNSRIDIRDSSALRVRIGYLA